MADPNLRFPIYLSILAGVLTLLLKSAAYWVTGSVGLLSDAAESVINLLAALTAFAALSYAARPIDSSHTYGHEKIEYFSSGLEGVLILVAAGGIAWYAILRLIRPEPLHALDMGVVIGGFASLINLAVAQVLLRVGKARGSIVLEADGQHLMTDVWTSVAVLAGLVMVWLTGLQWLDPVIALGVSVNIVWTACDLVRRSFNGLMDHALPEAEQAAVRAVIEKHLRDGMHYHALRTRRAGSRRFADFHLLVPGNWSVTTAHHLSDQIEEAVRQAIPGMEVTVHIEPVEEPHSWHDSELLRIEAEGRGNKP